MISRMGYLPSFFLSTGHLDTYVFPPRGICSLFFNANAQGLAQRGLGMAGIDWRITLQQLDYNFALNICYLWKIEFSNLSPQSTWYCRIKYTCI